MGISSQEKATVIRRFLEQAFSLLCNTHYPVVSALKGMRYPLLEQGLALYSQAYSSACTSLLSQLGGGPPDHPKTIPMNESSATANSHAPVSKLPPELLDIIASRIESCHDLLAFALVCRAFYRTASPRHLEYRVLRCAYQDESVWSHLRERKDLAANVRTVRICDGLDLEGQFDVREHVPTSLRPPSLPWSVPSDDPEESASALYSVSEAVDNMVHLRRLTWSMSLAFSSQDERRAVAAIWDAVGRNPSLRELTFIQPLNPPSDLPIYPQDIGSYPLWSISNLTSITLSNVAFLRHSDSVKQFSRVLNHSPRLERLEIDVYDWTFDLGDLLGESKFGCLREVGLEVYADPEPNSQAFCDLLENTPSLEVVKWQYIPLRPLKEGSLPRLRRLHSPVFPQPREVHSAQSVLADKTVAPRPLVELGAFRLWADTFSMLRGIDGRTLRKLELSSFESIQRLTDVVGLFPRLTWLRIPSVDYMHDWHGITLEPIHTGQWVDVVCRLPELEVFHGVSLFKDPAVADNDQRARDIAATAPKLYRFDHWTLASNKVVVLVRDGDHVSWREETVEEY
ncbi:hypothetical protein OF83DRAFT_30615 [Amylostereum chailletii]|nr:hypothetical protein OF83DRAFT_30615 [Amylostereum chailletii]